MLEKIEDADQIVESACREFGVENVCLLSALAPVSSCVSGKWAWVRRHYPQFSNQMLFGSAKWFLAGPGRVLIDDWEENVAQFNKHGGEGILVPRLWNEEWRRSGEAAAIVARRLAGAL
jgi:hypothetical protein